LGSYIMNDKIYDTDKSEKICEGYIAEANPLTLFRKVISYTFMNEIFLYRTQKGNYFCTYPHNFGKAKTLSEDESKNIMKHYNYTRYCELYDPLEEA